MLEKDENEKEVQEFIYSQLTNTWVYNPYFLDKTVEYTVSLEDE